MIAELDSLSSLLSSLSRRASADGLRAIARAQTRRVSRVVVQGGRVEETGISSASGLGVQVVTEEGRTALGSRDDFAPDEAEGLFDRVVRAARSAEALRVAAAPIAWPDPVRARDVPADADAFVAIDLARVRGRLLDLEREIAGTVPGPTLRLSFASDLDAWRIARSDGTDVVFAMPRCTLRLSATSAGVGDRHTVGASASGPSPALLDDPAWIATFLARARRAARLATLLPDAPAFPSGSYPLVIDHALAKGLAHEAFGHASEADSFRSSILARDGRFRTGDRVGAPHVSVVDEPIRGDHAWQPFSANGVPRRRATIVDHGRLRDGLSDFWSDRAGGVSLTGAERAESFRNAPLPRMTNIRVEIDRPLPAPGAFEEYGPEEVRDLLAAAGVFRRHPELVFLSGYAGGQVNTVIGEFVFHCKAIYRLSAAGVELHRPAIFSGSMFGALSSIREGFGPLLLDAIGTCGKWGQSVPSSGGSHYFLVLDPDPSVRLGGR